MPNKPMMFRPTPQARALIEAIRAKTGYSLTRILIDGIELLAKKYNVKLPKDGTL